MRRAAPPSENRRAYATMAAATIVAAVIIAAAVLAATGRTATVTKIEISTSYSTTTVTRTDVSTSTTTFTATTSYPEDVLLAACSNAAYPEDGFPSLYVSTNVTALLCLQAYYYNYTSTYTLNVSQGLYIEAARFLPNGQPAFFSGAPNFTVVATPSELVIGGPDSENEGATIVYALTAKPGASGTYELEFSSSYVINNGPESCGYYGEVVAGSGEPSYLTTGFSGCIAYSMSVTAGSPANSTEYTILDKTLDLRNGDLYFQISGTARLPQALPP